MAFNLNGFATVAQDYLSETIASFLYNKSPFLAMIGAQNMGRENRHGLNIGRPDAGEVFSGGRVSPAERLSLPTCNRYVVHVDRQALNNTRTRTGSGRVALPTVANETTESHAQTFQFGATFYWTHFDTPILIWHEDKIRASEEPTRAGQSMRLGWIIENATQKGYQDLLDTLAQQCWTGTVTNQSDDLWDSFLGLIEITSTTNTYAGVDRTVESQWRGQLVTTATSADVTRNLDDVNLGNSAGTIEGLRTKAGGANLCLTTSSIYRIYKAQILSGSNGGVILQNGLPEMGKMGVRMEVLQKDNCYFIYDPFCPANTAVFLDSEVIKFAVRKGFNFVVKPFVDNTETGLGRSAYDYSYLQLRAMLICENPKMTVRFSNLS